MTDLILDASVALRWFLQDEADRAYCLAILASLSEKQAVVPPLWFYEVGNGLLMAYRRRRISFAQIEAFLTRLKALPIEVVNQTMEELCKLPILAESHNLTNYDAAYLALAQRLDLPLATTDASLRKAATIANVGVVQI